MAVTVGVVFVCDLCGVTLEQRLPASAYTEVLVAPPPGWTSEFDVPDAYRRHPCMDICDACPQCQQQPDWTRYQERHDW